MRPVRARRDRALTTFDAFMLCSYSGGRERAGCAGADRRPSLLDSPAVTAPSGQVWPRLVLTCDLQPALTRTLGGIGAVWLAARDGSSARGRVGPRARRTRLATAP